MSATNLNYIIERSVFKMFPLSSQKKYWTFVDETDLIRLRNEANMKFIVKHGANMTVSCFNCNVSYILVLVSKNIPLVVHLKACTFLIAGVE